MNKGGGGDGGDDGEHLLGGDGLLDDIQEGLSEQRHRHQRFLVHLNDDMHGEECINEA